MGDLALQFSSSFDNILSKISVTYEQAISEDGTRHFRAYYPRAVAMILGVLLDWIFLIIMEFGYLLEKSLLPAGLVYLLFT